MFGITCAVRSMAGAKAFAELPGTSAFSLHSTSANSSLGLSSSSKLDDFFSDASDSDDDEVEDNVNTIATCDQFLFRSFHEPRMEPLLDNTFVPDSTQRPRPLKRSSSFSHFVYSPGDDEEPFSLCCEPGYDTEVAMPRALVLLESGNITAAESEVFTNYMSRAFELAGV